MVDKIDSGFLDLCMVELLRMRSARKDFDGQIWSRLISGSCSLIGGNLAGM